MTATPVARVDLAAVRGLFDGLVDLPPAERAERLRTEAAAPAVLREVRELLAHHEAEEHSGGHFLAEPAVLQGLAVPAGRAGQRLGPWQLDAVLGTGGMGEVWSAHRADGAYEAQVAVKLLRGGLATQALLERFQQEQRTLARIDHPHIARLFDAGRSDDGVPWFVLERVDGQRIDEACRGRPLEQRLALFLQLTDAVAFAHRALLVHRDLKPANVLVSRDGQVKLLDFGLAQAPQGADAAPPEARGLTPSAASPEQVRGEALGTATDVYSLGVLLHLLLTGARPYGQAARSAAELTRAVLDEAPLPPSRVLRRDDPALALPARRLQGDLDAIVARALAKRPEDRYASVDALAADLQAHLQHQPVAARPATFGYVAGTFVRRHRAAVAVAAAGLAALLAALAGLAWQVQKTELARRDAEARVAEVRQLANRLVFNYHDRIVNLAGSLTAREALLADALQYLDSLARTAPRDPQLARELAGTYLRVAVLYGETFSANLGKTADAEASLDKGLALLPLYLPVTTDLKARNEAADMWQLRAQQHARQGRLRPAVQALEEAQRVIDRSLALAPDNLDVMSHQATLVGRRAQMLGGTSSLANLGRLDDAGRLWRASLQIFETLVARQPQDPEWQHELGWALSGFTAWALLEGRVDEALQASERLVTVRDAAAAARADDGHLRYQTATARLNRATALAAAGRLAQAAEVLLEGRARIAAEAAANPGNRAAVRDLALTDIAHARILVAAGQPAAALPLLRSALAQLPAGAALADDFFLRRWRAEAQVWLARALMAAQPGAALEQAQAAVELMQGGDDDNAARRWTLALALGEQAQALRRTGAPARAAEAARQALAAWGGRVPGSMTVWRERDRALALALAEAPR
jgi:hypothetical protein